VGNEVHSLSQVFTGGIYDTLADIFAFERNQQRASKDPAQVLLEVGQHVAKLLLAGIDAAPANGATFADVVNGMLQASANQGDPPIYRTFLRNRFTLREVVVSPTPLTAMSMGEIPEDPNFTEGGDVVHLEPAMKDHPSLKARQDRSLCCGTMQLPEYYQGKKAQDSQLKELRETGEPIDPVRVLGEDVQRLKKEFAAL
jgi:hypothetical protein